MNKDNSNHSKKNAKSIKLDYNDFICPLCNKIISIPNELYNDALLQCPHCDSAINNPLLLSDFSLICNNCHNYDFLPKTLVNELEIICKICGAENLNPYSPNFNGTNCPYCNNLIHVPNEIKNSNYIECPNCLKSFKKSFKKQVYLKDNNNYVKESEYSIFSKQYWIEYKKKYPHYEVVLVFACIIFFGGFYSLMSNSEKTPYKQKNQEINSETNWYEGGTLHKVSVNEWKNATNKNKLATCTDFVASVDKNISSKEELYSKAFELQCCIDQAVKGADNLNPTVAEIASFCLISLGYKN